MSDSLAILVVDDDQSIQSVVEEILGESGFQPAVASTGEEALTLLSANGYRLLVIDISFGNDRIKGWDVGPAGSRDRSVTTRHLHYRRQRQRLGDPRRAQQHPFD